MVKAQPMQKIDDIEREHPDRWLMIEVLRRNKRLEATHGRLLAETKHRDSAYRKVKNYHGPNPLYSTCTYKPRQMDYCLAFTIKD